MVSCLPVLFSLYQINLNFLGIAEPEIHEIIIFILDIVVVYIEVIGWLSRLKLDILGEFDLFSEGLPVIGLALTIMALVDLNLGHLARLEEAQAGLILLVPAQLRFVDVNRLLLAVFCC